MKLREVAALIFSVAGMIGLVSVALIQTVQVGSPQTEVLLALTAVTAAASQWLFRNGNGKMK